jgi:hypothetical protein
MRKAVTFAKKITEWELLNTNIKPHLPDMPHLQGVSADLDALIVQSKQLDSQQEVARANCRTPCTSARRWRRRGRPSASGQAPCSREASASRATTS